MNVFFMMLSWTATLPSLFLASKYADGMLQSIAMFYAFSLLIFAGSSMVAVLIALTAERMRDR